MPPKKKKNNSCSRATPKKPAENSKKKRKVNDDSDEALLQQVAADRAEDERKKAAEAMEAAHKEIASYWTDPTYIEDPSAEQLEDATDAKIDANDLASQGMIDPEAIQRMTDALGVKSDSAAYWAFRASLYLRADKQHCALKDAERALELDSHSAAALNIAGKVYFRLGLWQQAADKLSRANSIKHDEDTAVLAERAKKLASTDNAATATAAVIRAIKVAQWLVLGCEGGGTVNGHKYSKQECYIKALEIDPSDVPSWCNLGVVGGGTVNGHKYSKQECYIKALEIDQSDVPSWYNLGKAGGGTVNRRAFTGEECFAQAEVIMSSSQECKNESRHSTTN